MDRRAEINHALVNCRRVVDLRAIGRELPFLRSRSGIEGINKAVPATKVHRVVRDDRRSLGADMVMGLWIVAGFEALLFFAGGRVNRIPNTIRTADENGAVHDNKEFPSVSVVAGCSPCQ